MSEAPPAPELRVPTDEELNAAALVDPTALQHWGTIPETASVALLATRADLDRLFLGLRLLTFAQGDHLAAFNLLSHGNTEEATKRYLSATVRHGQALASLTLFTSGVMAKARVDG